LTFDLTQDPYFHFQREFQKAEALSIKDANAMALATATKFGIPSLRTVLYKGLVRQGFSFYTNYESQKSKELEENNRAAVLFFWTEMEEQIRIEGEVFKLTRAESEAYFKTRPRLSQIGAWASSQGEKIPHRDYLEMKVKELDKTFHGQEIPCPSNWGGWHLLPLRFEFWFGHAGRLHDRYVYDRESLQSSNWKTYMKAP
jgi:pyridoxamine 5'-phosphate oxidase